MIYLYILTGITLFLSFLFDRKKSIESIKIGLKILYGMFLPLVIMLVFVSLTLALIPDTLIMQYLSNENIFLSYTNAIFIGSLIIMPGVVAFPLSGHLLEKGVSFGVLSAFTTTLMLVGILTYAVEKKYLGARITIVRNVFALIISVVVAFFTGLILGS
jgi:uncharacterized membrane protein YraQ (UPF0718 family)